MEDGSIVIKYKFEQKEIPIPKTFIELKYYYCQSFKKLFDFDNYEISYSKNNNEDKYIKEENFEEEIEEICNLDEPIILMVPKNSAIEEEQEEKYEKIKNDLNQVYQKKFDEYKKKFKDDLDKKLTQILKEILGNLNLNK